MTTRVRLIALAIVMSAVALVTCLWVNEGPLWRWVMLKTLDYESSFDGFASRGEMIHNRWTHYVYGKFVSYYVKTGFVSMMDDRRGGQICLTQYNVDGAVVYQSHATKRDGTDLVSKRSPPWWWGVKDQTEPTAPWWGRNDSNGQR